MTKPGIEVVICSHNGSSRLPAALEALAAQTLASQAWGVLVVDNASTDDTASAARRAWSRSDVTLQVLSEPRPGLMFARERAFSGTDRSLICFCDDDNLLAPDYLQRAFDLMERLPRVGILGGKGEPVSELPLPDWFAGASRGFAVGPQSDVDGEIPAAMNSLYGAGMILRRTAWDRLAASGFEWRLLGRSGSRLSAGEDQELCLMLSAMGWQLYYSHLLSFQHLIPQRRLDEAYCRALYRGFGEASTVLSAYRDFLLGRASPTAWRGCAALRLVESWLARASDRFQSDRRGPLNAGTLWRELRREKAAGHAAGCRTSYKGLRLFALYRDIAAWLAVAREGSVFADQPLAEVGDRGAIG